MLVLRTLALAPLHGYGISKAIRGNSSDALNIEFGSLYPALKRLEAKGWISAKWMITENKRRARVYEITAAGRKQLKETEGRWRTVTTAIDQVLQRA